MSLEQMMRNLEELTVELYTEPLAEGQPAASLVIVVVAALEVEVPVVDDEDVDVGVDDVTGPEDVPEDIVGLDAC